MFGLLSGLIGIILMLGSCSSGGVSPGITIAFESDVVCHNLSNNESCNIVIFYNNGTTNPTLNYALTPENTSVSTGITANGSFESALQYCQESINATLQNTPSSCIFSFTYTSQGDNGSNADLKFNLNAEPSNSLNINGN